MNGKQDLANVLRLLTLNREIILDYLEGPNVITWSFKKRRGRQRSQREIWQNGMSGTLEVGEFSTLCCSGPSGRWHMENKRRKWILPKPTELRREPRAPDGSGSPAKTLIFSPVRPWAENPATPCWTSDRQSCKLTNECCLKPLSLW